jgi:hypothetical protein
MICPHDVETHFVVVLRAEEAAVEGLFEKGLILVPIPVKDEHVNAVVDGRLDLLFHHSRIGFVAVSPRRDARLRDG